MSQLPNLTPADSSYNGLALVSMKTSPRGVGNRSIQQTKSLWLGVLTQESSSNSQVTFKVSASTSRLPRDDSCQLGQHQTRERMDGNPRWAGQNIGRVGGMSSSRSWGWGQGCARPGVSNMWVGRKLGFQTQQHSGLRFFPTFSLFLGSRAKIKKSSYAQSVTPVVGKPEKLRRHSHCLTQGILLESRC